jgi:hypothetical protein
MMNEGGLMGNMLKSVLGLLHMPKLFCLWQLLSCADGARSCAEGTKPLVAAFLAAASLAANS